MFWDGFIMNSNAGCEEFDIKREEDPLSLIEIKIEQQDEESEIKEETEGYNNFSEPHDIKQENETIFQPHVTFIKTISEVEGTQESLDTFLEDCEEKSQDEKKIAGEDEPSVTAEVYNLCNTHETNFQEQKCDDYLQEKVDGTQESVDKLLEDYKNKSQQEQKNTGEDGTNVVSVVHNQCETYGTDSQEQKCDDFSRENSNIHLCDKVSMFSQTADRCFKCNTCNKLFSSKSGLVRHTLCHTNEKPFKCNICSKLFSRKSYLTRHTCTHTNAKPFICNICNKSFTRKSQIKAHLYAHKNGKSFNCDIFNKAFSDKPALTGHTYIHRNEKRFNCNVCSKSFSRKSHLKEHIGTHTNEKPFKCNFCSKSFTRKSQIKVHIIICPDK